jgi:hypothetical protein
MGLPPESACASAPPLRGHTEFDDCHPAGPATGPTDRVGGRLQDAALTICGGMSG